MTTEGILALAGASHEFESLVGRYFTRISYLHGTWFYNGMCGPGRRTSQTANR